MRRSRESGGDAVKVAVRIRPISERETAAGLQVGVAGHPDWFTPSIVVEHLKATMSPHCQVLNKGRERGGRGGGGGGRWGQFSVSQSRILCAYTFRGTRKRCLHIVLQFCADSK